RRMIRYYGVEHLVKSLDKQDSDHLQSFAEKLAETNLSRSRWLNVGGQLIREEDVRSLRDSIRQGAIRSWDEVHDYYLQEGARYEDLKTRHALGSLLELEGIAPVDIDQARLSAWIAEHRHTRQWMLDAVSASREKDYSNPFRRMMYDNQEELDEVIGKFEE